MLDEYLGDVALGPVGDDLGCDVGQLPGSGVVLDNGYQLGGERVGDSHVEFGSVALFVPDDAHTVGSGLSDLAEFGRAVFTRGPDDLLVHAAKHDLFVATVVEVTAIDVESAARVAARKCAAGTTATRRATARRATARRATARRATARRATCACRRVRVALASDRTGARGVSGSGAARGRSQLGPVIRASDD